MPTLDWQPGEGSALPWRGCEAEAPGHVNRTLNHVGHNQNVYGADFASRFGHTGCLQGSFQVGPLLFSFQTPISLAAKLPDAEHFCVLFLSPELHQEVLAPKPTVLQATDSVRAPHAWSSRVPGRTAVGMVTAWQDARASPHLPRSPRAGLWPRRHNDHCLHRDSEHHQLHLSPQHLQVSRVHLGTFLMPLFDLWFFWASSQLTPICLV